jgi:acetylornithine deacetylase/succinyl-diaminopimelate desuccinylase-like protein
VDPVSEWLSPPFEPDIRELEPGRLAIFARGASDDKGQVMTFIEACRAWKTVTGALPLDATIIIEGEEEVGSPNLSSFITANIAEFDADFALICDTDMADRRVPAITTSLRGVVHDELTITCALCDLHSGVYGGAARNPLHVLSRIVAAIHDETGGITIPGFYDGMRADVPCETPNDEALELTAENFLHPVGLSVSAGEQGYSILRQTTERPSLDVNGQWGGYCGEGTKTIIPSQAHAKVSMRLVAGQQPAAVRAAFRAFVRARLPADCSVSFAAAGKGTPAVVLKGDTPLVKTVKAALADEWGAEAALIATGGSIPAASDFALLGLPVLMTGFSLADDGQHSPNEKYDLQSFHRGIRSWARVLAALA